MDDFGLDFKDFDNLVGKFEQMGGNVEYLANQVLNAGEGPAKEAFRKNVPRGKQKNKQGHAQDNVTVSTTKKSKYGTHYRLISFKGDRSYLFMVDRGSSKMPAHPWHAKAREDAQSAAKPAMEQALVNEINKYLGE